MHKHQARGGEEEEKQQRMFQYLIVIFDRFQMRFVQIMTMVKINVNITEDDSSKYQSLFSMTLLID